MTEISKKIKFRETVFKLVISLLTIFGSSLKTNKTAKYLHFSVLVPLGVSVGDANGQQIFYQLYSFALKSRSEIPFR